MAETACLMDAAGHVASGAVDWKVNVNDIDLAQNASANLSRWSSRLKAPECSLSVGCAPRLSHASVCRAEARHRYENCRLEEADAEPVQIPSPRLRQGYLRLPIFLLQMNVRDTGIPGAGLGPEGVNRFQRSIHGCGSSVVGRERALRYEPRPPVCFHQLDSSQRFQAGLARRRLLFGFSHL
jgi:hypothetical protein